MPLFDTGERINGLDGGRARATDELGRAVVVSASSEAITDKGWDAIFDAACNKFDRGDCDKSGAPPVVRITTADLKASKSR